MNWLEELKAPVASEMWADAETAYERFLADHEQIDVLMLCDADFEAWRLEYGRLYLALWDAQIAYYRAVRA